MIWPSRRRKKQKTAPSLAGSNTATSAPSAMIQASGGFITPAYTSWTSATSATFGTTGATGVTRPYYVTHTPEPAVTVVKDMGLSIEPMVGLRSYYVDVEAMMLTSYNGIGWPHREPLYGYCVHDAFGDHEVPGEECQCGIYAWDEKYVGADGILGQIYGEVYLWGDVLVCERGFRAEIGYPKNLTIKGPKTRVSLRIRDGLQEAYGIPVTLIPQGEEAAIDEYLRGSNPELGT